MDMERGDAGGHNSSQPHFKKKLGGESRTVTLKGLPAALTPSSAMERMKEFGVGTARSNGGPQL